jgi:hypothetical protein
MMTVIANAARRRTQRVIRGMLVGLAAAVVLIVFDLMLVTPKSGMPAQSDASAAAVLVGGAKLIKLVVLACYRLAMLCGLGLLAGLASSFGDDRIGTALLAQLPLLALAALLFLVHLYEPSVAGLVMPEARMWLASLLPGIVVGVMMPSPLERAAAVSDAPDAAG